MNSFEMNEDQDSFSALTCSELQQYLNESRNIYRNQNDDFLINAIKVLDSLFGVKEAKRLISFPNTCFELSINIPNI